MLPCQMSQPLQPMPEDRQTLLSQPLNQCTVSKDTTSKYDGIPGLDVCQQCINYEARLDGERARADEVQE